MAKKTDTGRNRGRSTAQGGDPLDIYLREVESHDLLTPDEEREHLARLIEVRNAWMRSFLHTEAGLEAVWQDLQACDRGEISPASIIPGPPQLKPGQIGPAHHAPRLHAMFERHIRRHGKNPFRYRLRGRTAWLVRALLHVGLRPAPLERYRLAAEEHHGASAAEKIAQARELFIETRRPLVERNLRLVLKVAWSFIPGPMSFDELIQEGNIGLIRATESFNGRFNVRFSTYAYLWIRQSVIRALEEKSRMIRLPVHLTHLLRKVAKDKRNGVETPAVVSYQGKKYRMPALMANPTVTGSLVSLDASRDEDGSMAEVIPDRGGESPEAGASRQDLRDFVHGSLDVLNERQRTVLELRFGLGRVPAHTLGEIGRVLGVSSERVRQIQEEALEVLRESEQGEILAELAGR
ncbi:MAG: sigma-70 family RNA polymerase sigma factor [Planctomycetota bacterium]